MWYPLPKETESDHILFTNNLHSSVTVKTTYYCTCGLVQLHYQESICDKITKLRRSINPFKMWQSSNIWNDKKSKWHAWRNLEQIKFRVCLLPFGAQACVFTVTSTTQITATLPIYTGVLLSLALRWCFPTRVPQNTAGDMQKIKE